MDDTERIAKEYLSSLNLGELTYEPDGNVPPDFLIDGDIAVEVRRLNQQIDLPGGGTEALDSLSNPFIKGLERYLQEISPSIDGESWFVYVSFSRPLEGRQELRKQLKNALVTFMKDRERTRCTLSITPHLEIDLKRANQTYPSFFQIRGYDDLDSGGFVLAETIKGLLVCIPEKEKKIAPFRGRYSEWWLVLVNHISLRLNSEDQRRLRESPPLSHSWDKVILVNPLVPSDAFEI